jgi:hypothetical protein
VLASVPALVCVEAVRAQDSVGAVNVGASKRVFARRLPVSWFGEASYVELESDFDTLVAAFNSHVLPPASLITLEVRRYFRRRRWGEGGDSDDG